MREIDEVRTPGLLLDLDRFEANTADLVAIAQAHGIEYAPHAKTHRIPELGRRQLAAGAARLTVAKLGEAEAFAEAGVTAILVAVPIVGTARARRALELHRRADLRLTVDSAVGAADLGAVFAAAGERARVLIAVDTGLGREGVAPAEAPGLAALVAATPGLELLGVLTHEGHAYAAIDAADLVDRAAAAARRLVATAVAIRAAGIPCAVVSLGCSASVAAVATVPGVTELRPGIASFGDVGLLALGVLPHDRMAVRVVATVVSAPEPGRACIDAGSKALGADLILASAHRDEFGGYGLLEGAPGWVLERLSEEHGWLRPSGVDAPGELVPGQRVTVIPNHVCMAFAALRRATAIRGDAVVGVWEGLGPGASE